MGGTWCAVAQSAGPPTGLVIVFGLLAAYVVASILLYAAHMGEFIRHRPTISAETTRATCRCYYAVIRYPGFWFVLCPPSTVYFNDSMIAVRNSANLGVADLQYGRADIRAVTVTRRGPWETVTVAPIRGRKLKLITLPGLGDHLRELDWIAEGDSTTATG